MFRFLHKKTISLLLAFTVLVILFISLPQPQYIPIKVYYYLNPNESIQCYHYTGNTLQDISTEVNPKKGKSIFFHETSCNSYHEGKIVITSRQACAVESAAKMNPNYDVYLLYASPGIFDFQGTQSDRFMQAILTYDNVRILHVDFKNYTTLTPLQHLYESGKIEFSQYARSHASDVLRYLTLYKYGGIYLDLDVIVIKSLEGLKQNYAGSESDENVAAGVLSFGQSGAGRTFAKKCLMDLKERFSGYDWGNNGPGVITRLLKEICKVDKAKDMLNKDCQGFKVYPPESFYPVPWWNWTMYLDERYTDQVMNLSKNSYVIHVWNKYSSNIKIPVGSKIPYGLFAQKYCPKVYNECDEYF